MKQTEIGLIPDDWEVKTLNDYFDIGSSKRVFQSQWRKSGIPFYRAREVVILAEKNSVENDLFIDEDLYNQYKKLYGVPAVNDLLVTGVGTLGKVYKIQNNKPFYFKDGNIICLKNKGKIDSDYVKYHFDYPIVKDQINDNSGKSTVGTYTINSARKTTLPIPPLDEQQRIAKALSDVDALISTTEKLIQKKKNIKQGTMQNLLTGKKRLPGFAKSTNYKQSELGLIPEDWEVKNINKECTIKARIGWQGLKSTEYLDSGDYILITGTDFDSGFINWKSCSYVSKWRFDQDKNIQIKRGDVLITKDGTIGKVAFLNEIPMQGTLNSGVFVIRPKNPDKIDTVFLSLIFKSFWFDSFLEQITSGSTIVHLYQKDFVKFNFPLPSIKEQTAIANVLSSMDKEIETLNTKLEKYRNLKTAMMQQLLTGKIRLVKK